MPKKKLAKEKTKKDSKRECTKKLAGEENAFVTLNKELVKPLVNVKENTPHSLRKSSVKRKQKLDIEKIELVLPFGMLSQIRNYLFRDPSMEYCSYLLCGHAKINKKLRLLGCYLVNPDESDYETQSIASLHIKQDCLTNILNECARLGLSLIDIHSHPFSQNSVDFSSIDEADEMEKAKWYSENLPNCYYGSIVMGTNSHKARLRAGDSSVFELPLELKSIELPIKTKENKLKFEKNVSEMYDRHIRAFGKDGQQAISNAHFAIVGLGGLGAGLAIGLARLGAKKFTLIDFDRAEMTNLNRIEGMTQNDARLNVPKVDIVARNLLEIDPMIQCERVCSDILNPDSWRLIRDVDLIITATDNYTSRTLLNRLSQLYLIPQVSVGTLISVNNGTLDGGYGHIYTMLPGHNQPCLCCVGIIDPIETYYEATSEDDRREAARSGYIQGFDEPAPSVVHLNGIIINIALIEIHNLFCDFKQFSRHLVYSMLDEEILYVNDGERNCATCSEGGGIFGRGDLIDPGYKLIPIDETKQANNLNSRNCETIIDSSIIGGNLNE